MKYLKTYNESKLEDDYTWWFGENIEGDSPLINAIKIIIKENAPEYLPEFYYKITNNEDIEILIEDIYKKSNIKDDYYLKELKRRNKMKNKIK